MLKALTPGPVSSTTPAISMPSTAGSGCLACAALPALIFVSSGFTPLATILTATCLLPGTGQTIADSMKLPPGSYTSQALRSAAPVVIQPPSESGPAGEPSRESLSWQERSRPDAFRAQSVPYPEIARSHCGCRAGKPQPRQE